MNLILKTSELSTSDMPDKQHLLSTLVKLLQYWLTGSSLAVTPDVEAAAAAGE